VNRTTRGLDGRTLNAPAYRASQIVRKRIEQFFGWGKTVGGLARPGCTALSATRS